jgi:shikimate kinase
MGVGKSTIGAGLAARLGRPLRDSDADLQATRHIRGRELAAREGVDALHRWEAEHLLRAVGSPEPSVVAAAASVVDDPRVREALRRPFVVWLRAPARALAARMSPSDHRRPLAAAGSEGAAGTAGAPAPDGAIEAVEALEAERGPRYASVADLEVDTGGVLPDDVVLTVLDALPPGLQRVGRAPGPPEANARPRAPGSGAAAGVRSPGRAHGS